jgi:nitrite reductase/ring-hydroxylating ferredoxin subunit
VRSAHGGAGIVLVRHGGRIHALADRCSHRGCSLGEGAVADGALTCACHGSRYDLAGGRVLRGPATAPQPVLQTRVREGRVEVRRPPE